MEIITTKTFDSHFHIERIKLEFIKNFEKFLISKEEMIQFGKDGAYRDPKLQDGSLLRHVHVKPLNPKMQKTWNYAHKNNSRKTSNDVLIYAIDGSRVILIDYLINSAHEQTNYVNDKVAPKLLWCAKIANQFINGKNITESKSLFSTLLELLNIHK